MTQGFKDRMHQSSMKDKAMPKEESWNKIQKKLKKQRRRSGRMSLILVLSTLFAVILILILALLMLYYIKIKTSH